MAEQLDWIGIEDRLAQRRRLLAESVKRIGLSEVAHQLDEDPSTIDNQISRRDRKRPSSDLSDICEELDPVYRHAKALLKRETLVPIADLTGEQVSREIGVRAGAKGYVSREEVFELLARMKREEPEAVQPLRVAP